MTTLEVSGIVQIGLLFLILIQLERMHRAK
jgi:hypothetical protein